MSEDKPRVVLIGLDGATWDLIKPWAENGKLPTFKQLMDEGCWGVLESTIPPLSPSAWVSIYTGCKPAKHGIFGFVKRKENSYFYRPISSRDIKKPTVWEILSKHNIRSIVINALFAYPPKKINGILITGLGTPSKYSNFVYPPSYKNLILSDFPKYDVDFNEDLLISSNDVKETVRRVEEITLEQIRLTKYFFENEKWSFMFSIFRALDVIQHFFWNDKDIILKFYRIFDEFLMELIKKFNENDDNKYVLFIVSDHGFGPVKKYFCVNNWLEQIGMLKTYKQKRVHIITAESIKKALLKLGMRKVVWKLKRSPLIEELLKIIPSEDFDYMNLIEWEKTKAYFYEASDGIINLNLKGREPFGVVTEDEYNDVVKFIVDKLKDLKDPETGEKIVENVYSKIDLFNTDDIDVPDIFILMANGYRAVSYNKLDGRSMFMPPIHGRVLRPGDHYLHGIFIAYGWGISKKRLEKTVKVYDILPTILSVLKIQPYNYMDGKIIMDVFKLKGSEKC